MSESKFQARCFKAFKRDGGEVQKFTDLLQGGIPDCTVGWTGGGAWIEFKWVPELPARKATPMMNEGDFRPGQIPWLRRWWGKPLPTAVVVGSPLGWIVVPGPLAPDLYTLPHTQFDWINAPISIEMIMHHLRCLRK